MPSQLGVTAVAGVTIPWPRAPVLSVYHVCRLILAKREAKAVTEADTEALDWWYDLEDDFELLSFKAWNAVIYQVTPCSLLSLSCIPTDCPDSHSHAASATARPMLNCVW